MKSTLTTIGTVAASVVLTSAAYAQDSTRPGQQSIPPTSGSALGSTSAADQSRFEGRIVSLFEYLSGTHSSDASSSSISSGSTSSSSTALPSTSTDAASRPTLAGRDRGPGSPSASGATSAFSGSGAWAGQPLALVVEKHASSGSLQGSTSAGTAEATTTSPAAGSDRGNAGINRSATSSAVNEAGTAVRNATDTASERIDRARQSAYSSVAGSTSSNAGTSGDVYVLVFNPQDPDSRAAFTKAQWMISGRASGAGLSTTTTDSPQDRLPVRGLGDDDNAQQQRLNTSATRLQNQLNPKPATGTAAGTTATADQQSSASGRTDQEVGKSSISMAHGKNGKQVIISGRILNKGGIQALEVSNIEDNAPASATRPAGGLVPSGTRNIPEAQPLQPNQQNQQPPRNNNE